MTFTDNPLSNLLSAVINRALDDIKCVNKCERRKRETDHAMAFILSETCESYCLYIDLNYEELKKHAAELYRDFIKTDPPEYRLKKHVRRSAKHLKRVQVRKVTGKRRIVTDR